MISFHMRPFEPLHAADARHFSRNWRSTEVIKASRLARCMSTCVWSPCVWVDGQRAKRHFIGARWAVLDFDDGRYTIANALSDWGRFIHVLGTTKSHQLAKDGRPPCDRFRLAVLWAEDVTDLGVYEGNLRKLARRFGADPACVDGARLYYPCKAIVSASEDGEKLRVGKAQPQRSSHSLPEHCEAFPARAIRFLAGHLPIVGVNSRGEPTRHRNDEAFYFANRALERGWEDDQTIDAIRAATDLPESEVRTLVAKVRKNMAGKS